jgi:FdhD protein
MHPQGELPIFKVTRDGIGPAGRRVVQEYPLKLVVNGQELATLIASPHRLNFLVAGFLRLQGFISCLDEVRMLGICTERGVAEVRIRGEVPERLRPTLTSGCGTGIVFNLPTPANPLAMAPPPLVGGGRGEGATADRHLHPGPPPSRGREFEVARRFTPDAVFSLMRELSRRAEQYASHGGIHSAAVGDGQHLLLFAEDLGRHNTLDRIAGEALFKGVDLCGRLLATSGRISTEMVAKAASLGIAVVASRTSPTDLAVRAAEAAGITLIGYLRGDSFEVYSHPQRLAVAPAGAGLDIEKAGAGTPHPGNGSRVPTPRQGRIPGVTGVILAGGASRRMGCDKSLLPLAGARFIERIFRQMSALFDEVLIVTNSPDLYDGLPCRKVPDLYPQKGSLAGIHSGLSHARTDKIFVVACDMPFLSAEVIRRLCERGGEGEVIIPRSERGVEPLHALYNTRCLPAVEEMLDAGEKKIVRFFPRVQVCVMPPTAFADCDPDGRSFRNINTPQEYFALRDGAREERLAGTELAPPGRLHG